jgi:putative intracellular protease/amidase
MRRAVSPNVEDKMSNAKKILMIVTSHSQLGATNTKTGFWLEELAAPYYEFVKAGAEVDIASPNGGRPAADPKSESNPSAIVREFLNDPIAMGKLSSTLRLSDIEASYDAYFVVGGHGVMWDLPNHSKLNAMLADAHELGRVVAAVCHGPAALVNVRLSNGSYLVSGKRVAGFTNDEESAVGLDRIVPFALESKLKERGAKYEATSMWAPLAIRDGNLVTGQNPASSVAVARETIQALA